MIMSQVYILSDAGRGLLTGTLTANRNLEKYIANVRKQESTGDQLN